MSEYKVMNQDRDGNRIAVFKAVYYPSGSISFWQQISKGYFYKKYAYKKLDQLINNNK